MLREALLLAAISAAAAVEPPPAGAATAASAQGEAGAAWDFGRLQSYEPMYFLVGPRVVVNAKFQISLRYQLYKPLHVSYTQTSLWDLESESKPFYDSAYKPRVWLGENHLFAPGWCADLGGAAGLGHESNGKSGADSRSINIAFVRPRARWGDSRGWHFDVEPMTYFYIEKEDNPDIQRYRGYCDLGLSLTGPRGWQFAAILRKGADHRLYVGSAQLDLSYDVGRLMGTRGGPFIQLQGFTGYGESIVDYNVRRESQIRLGLGLVR
ncbi:MAG: phospholipase A [Planctomycetes bacterium]|nr:phospholipase A [Planctomycetota bacterium]